MAIKLVFTVYDQKAEAYLQPFFMAGRGEAIRAFADLVNEPGHMFNKHPEDFTLFLLGSYDEGKGTFDCNKSPASLGTAIEWYQTIGAPANGGLAQVERGSVAPIFADETEEG